MIGRLVVSEADICIDRISWPRIRTAGTREIVLDLFVENSMLDLAALSLKRPMRLSRMRLIDS